MRRSVSWGNVSTLRYLIGCWQHPNPRSLFTREHLKLVPWALQKELTVLQAACAGWPHSLISSSPARSVLFDSLRMLFLMFLLTVHTTQWVHEEDGWSFCIQKSKLGMHVLKCTPWWHHLWCWALLDSPHSARTWGLPRALLCWRAHCGQDWLSRVFIVGMGPFFGNKKLLGRILLQMSESNSSSNPRAFKTTF